MNTLLRRTLMLAALALVLAGMVGCTAIQALTLDPSTLEQQAAPAPALRQSPSYYMDDPSVIQGALPGPMPVLRQSPSYYMDDPSVIEAAPASTAARPAAWVIAMVIRSEPSGH